MVIKLDEKLADNFLPLIPMEVRDYLEEEEAFCLGSVRDGTAVGVLVFSVCDGIHASGTCVAMIEIRWICTAEDYRRQGVAGELMETLTEITEDIPDTVMVCDIPLEFGYDLAEDFFKSLGFEFVENDIPVMEITREDCRTQSRYADSENAINPEKFQNMPKGVVSIGEIPAVKFRRAIKKMLEDENFRYYKNLSVERDYYDKDTSFVILNENEISSMVLFRRLKTNKLDMVMLDAMPGTDPREMQKLLHYSAAHNYMEEPENVVARLTLWKDKSRNLAVYVFPHKEMIMTRRGYRR